MKLVVMTTGREPSTVGLTLASVLASDWEGRITVSADPTGKAQLRPLVHHKRIDLSVWSPAEWHCVADSRVHRKAGAHYCRCLKMLADDPEGGIILEDDVVVRDDFMRETRQLASRARAKKSSDDFILLLYSSREPRRLDLKKRVNSMDPMLFFGTQAIYWTPKAVASVLPWLEEQAVGRDYSVYDLLIRRFGIDKRRPIFALPSESVVQHVGEQTTGMGQFHSSPTFANGAQPKPSKTCMLTAGVGGNWPKLALRLADRWRELHPKHSVHAVTELPEWLPCKLPTVSWLKVWGWEIVPPWCETLVWIDADVIPMRTIEPLPDGAFCAVPDAQTSVPHALRAMAALNPGKIYYNAGIWIARRPARPLFEALKQFLIAGSWNGQPFYEQSFVNLLLQNMPIKVTPLPREYNWMSAFGHPTSRVRLIHRAGSHGGLDRWWEQADAQFEAGECDAPQPAVTRKQPLAEAPRKIAEKIGNLAKHLPGHPPKSLSKQGPKSKRG